MNEPLRSPAGNTEYRLLDVNRSGGAQSALVLVALSGGGKRSAAFAFGVLRGMRDIPLRLEGKNSTLLDEVDLLAGVSGGSFPAAYYGLYGEKSFETFPDEFLYPDIEAYIWGTFLLPWNWDWVVNPLVGTNDRMTWVYDKLMFHGATFADFYRRGRPAGQHQCHRYQLWQPVRLSAADFRRDLLQFGSAADRSSGCRLERLSGAVRPGDLAQLPGAGLPVAIADPAASLAARRKRSAHPRLDREPLSLFER